MNEQFEKWQQQYQQSTANINVEDLIAQVTKIQKTERLKAWGELIIGAVVSIFCVYSAIYLIDEFTNIMLARIVFLIVSPIPIGFSIWAFKLRQKHWQQQGLNVKQVLQIQRKQALAQIHYWRISALVVCGLWFALVLMTILNYLRDGNWQFWALLALVNAIVVVTTVLRFVVLRRTLPAKLAVIDSASI